MKMKVCVMAVLLVLSLCACSAEKRTDAPVSGTEELAGTIHSTESDVTEEISETENVEANEAKPKLETERSEMQDDAGVKIYPAFDVQGKLTEAEEKAAALEKKLFEEDSLTQADMNCLSNDIYLVWDGVLNELWQALKESLDTETFDQLLAEQRAWITAKEAEVQQAGEDVGGGSMAPLVTSQRAAKLTKERVYELAGYLGYPGTGQESEETSSQEEKTTITFVVEGMEEEVPATVFEGKDYTISIPESGWEMIARECWASDVNGKAQFWVTDYAGEDVDAVREKLLKADRKASETDPYFLSWEDEDALVWNAKLYAEHGKTIGVFYTYPVEAAEGFGVRLHTIVDTFAWIQE